MSDNNVKLGRSCCVLQQYRAWLSRYLADEALEADMSCSEASLSSNYCAVYGSTHWLSIPRNRSAMKVQHRDLHVLQWLAPIDYQKNGSWDCEASGTEAAGKWAILISFQSR